MIGTHDHPRVAVVTGSGSATGRAVALALAETGYDIGIARDRDVEHAQRTADEVRKTGRRAEIRALDPHRLPDAAGVIDDLAETLGGIGVLINCATFTTPGPLLDTAWPDWRKTLTADLDGPFLYTRHAARQMIRAARGGRIITITAAPEKTPGPSNVAKAALTTLTRILAEELAEHSITVNAVLPGETAPRELTATVTFLTSREAAAVTGAAWSLDG